MIHKLTARALIRDYEDGILHENGSSHEVRPSAGHRFRPHADVPLGTWGVAGRDRLRVPVCE